MLEERGDGILDVRFARNYRRLTVASVDTLERGSLEHCDSIMVHLWESIDLLGNAQFYFNSLAERTREARDSSVGKNALLEVPLET